MAMGVATAIAMIVGSELADSAAAGYLGGVAVAIVVLVPLGLLLNRLLWSHPTVRRGIWIVMLAFVVTMGIDSSFAALPAKLAGVVGSALAIAMLANRVLDGSWFPSSKKD